MPWRASLLAVVLSRSVLLFIFQHFGEYIYHVFNIIVITKWQAFHKYNVRGFLRVAVSAE